MFNVSDTEGSMFNVSETRNKTLPEIPEYTESGFMWHKIIPFAFLLGIVVGFLLYQFTKKKLRIQLDDETEVVVYRTLCERIQANWRLYNLWAHQNRAEES